MLKSTELLGGGDPDPVMLGREGGRSPFLLACDHAGNAIPARLGTLGLGEADREDHIAIDIGIFSTSHWLAHRLDAPLIGQAYSRLVIDCNRRPGTVTSMPKVSDGRVVPGNADISEEERRQRVNEIFTPYHDALARLISKRMSRLGTPPILCAMHSFTRVYGGRTRECDIGVIHGEETEIASRLIHRLKAFGELRVGYNVPYEIDFAGDHTIPAHAVEGGIPYIEIEICQDLIATCAGQRKLASMFEAAFGDVEAALAPSG
jgi:predicted N-formylglutamate amidohydrolase